MAYEMQYHFKDIERETFRKPKILNYVLSILLVLCFAIMVHLGSSGLKMLLLGEWENAQTASNEMIASIKSGTSFDDAVYAFCEEIME